ncbi:hypothetical protein [Pyrobaculum neutrophilum]|uniref:Uncharacterized protein n=1 Tax=Pyrobaculum neutrophilum (strain DSM 2338 / JCM 9278 / NBRC 100436 / V24Sta) TaxID=444157 RepID=B1YAI5_PYRNV|nr:hypothetical protein [Pyrobaculum neutrophilum]ACB40634.1 conserved hypothetical protein [Pyrobaculum neutrophilum V24Sta]
MRKALFIATTSLTRSGVEACADFLEATAPRLGEFWLPLPRELCAGRPVDLGPLERYLEPLLALYHEVEADWRCYGSAEDLRRREMATAKLAALVIKARVYGKIDLREWDTYFSRPPSPPPTPSLVFGTVGGEELVICGAHPPNPIEAAHELWHTLTPQKKTELATWITKFIAHIVDSINLDEAYHKLIREGWENTYKTILGNSRPQPKW